MSSLAENEVLTAYLDGDLSEAEARALEDRLERDAMLRSELDDLRAAIGLVRDYGAVTAPMDFLDQVMAAVDEEPVQLAWYQQLRRPFGIPLEGIAVAAAAALVVFTVLPSTGPDDATSGKGALIDNTPLQLEKKAEVAPAAAAIDNPGEWDPSHQAPKQQLAKAPGVKAPTPAPTTAQTPAAGVEQAQEGVDMATNAYEPAVQPDMPGDADLATETVAPSTAKSKQGEADMVSVPYSYVIYTEDPNVFLRLQKLAARYRGNVTDSKYQPVEMETLSEDKRTATTMVNLPGDVLAEFGDQLSLLGRVEQQEEHAVFVGNHVDVRVTLKLVAGAPEQ